MVWLYSFICVFWLQHGTKDRLILFRRGSTPWFLHSFHFQASLCLLPTWVLVFFHYHYCALTATISDYTASPTQCCLIALAHSITRIGSALRPDPSAPPFLLVLLCVTLSTASLLRRFALSSWPVICFPSVCMSDRLILLIISFLVWIDAPFLFYSCPISGVSCASAVAAGSIGFICCSAVFLLMSSSLLFFCVSVTYFYCFCDSVQLSWKIRWLLRKTDRFYHYGTWKYTNLGYNYEANQG